MLVTGNELKQHSSRSITESDFQSCSDKIWIFAPVCRMLIGDDWVHICDVFIIFQRYPHLGI